MCHLLTIDLDKPEATSVFFIHHTENVHSPSRGIRVLTRAYHAGNKLIFAAS